MSYVYLDGISSPLDLKKLKPEQLKELSDEIRDFLITSISDTGGHLASNLGVVELTIALHYVFDSPVDKIVWDVGHQSYVHKLLTGRREGFGSLRRFKGISGFPKISESEHDAFSTGHSTTSLSAALGLAKARALMSGDGTSAEDYYVAAVIGDGAMTGGMAYEAFNNIGSEQIIIILNDNEMSISRNVGRMAKHFGRLRSRKEYFKIKDTAKKTISKIPLFNKIVFKFIKKLKKSLRDAIIHDAAKFEEFGIRYLGPVDGHDLERLIILLKRAKEIKEPVLIHIMTVKGKGFSHAENSPEKFHSVGKFCEPSSNSSFSEYFGSELVKYAEKDKNICAITAAMSAGTGLTEFSQKYPDRFFDVGIAEQHAVTFAAGLAVKGLRPVVAIYSSFLQRAYDQIIHDVALQNLPVILCVDRAGLVGEDGETHQGIFDVPFLTHIPNLWIFSPATYEDFSDSFKIALENKNPCAIRYPKEVSTIETEIDVLKPENYDIICISYGRLSSELYKAKKLLAKDGINISVIRLVKLKPLVISELKLNIEVSRIFFFEEGIITGGIGEQLHHLLRDTGYRGEYYLRGIDKFVEQGSVPELLDMLRLDANHIYQYVKEMLSIKL